MAKAATTATAGETSNLSVSTLTRSQRKKLQRICSKYETWYTLGVINVIVTTIMAVRFPTYYWILYSIKVLYYIPYRLYRFQKRNWELYLVDWCYVVNYMSDVCVILAFLRVAFGIVTPLQNYNAMLIKAGFAMACGPLLCSVYVFRNSIVFYDVDHNTSVFIHLSPFILMWCLRWGAGYGPGILQQQDDGGFVANMFDVCDSTQAYEDSDACLDTWSGWIWCRACSAPLSSFLIPPALLYIFVWSVPYFMFMFVWWKDWIEETKRETLYTYLIRTKPGVEAFFQTYFGVFGETYSGPVGYMVCHFLWSMITAGMSYLLWHSFLLFNIVFVFILITAIHNGSTYMFRVFAYRFVQDQLEKNASKLVD